MQILCDLKSNRIKVYISSSMKKEYNLEQRRAIKSFFDRMPIFDCFEIEDSASPESLNTKLINKVKNSLLNKRWHLRLFKNLPSSLRSASLCDLCG